MPFESRLEHEGYEALEIVPVDALRAHALRARTIVVVIEGEAQGSGGHTPEVVGRRLAGAPVHQRALVAEARARGGQLGGDMLERVSDPGLAGGEFDEAVLLPNSFRSAWLTRRAGIERRWGYPGGLRRPILAPAVARPGAHGPQVEDYALLLQAMEIPSPTDWTPRLRLDDAARTRGRELLARAGIDPEGGPIVGLFAGAEFGASKQWPRERFEEAARQIRRQRSDLQLTILAGPKEVWLAVRLHEETGKIHPVIGTDLDLADLAAVFSEHRALLTNDSGPMHLAAAVGVRCAALFGPTDPDRTAPAGDGHRVLSVDRWCSPCFRRRCPLLHHKCMTELGVEEAVNAVVEMADAS